MTSAPSDLGALQRDLGKAIKRLDDRREHYVKARAYYVGDVEEIVANRSIKRVLQASGEKHKLTFAAIPVDALIDRCELTTVTVKDANAQAALTAALEESDVDGEADDWMRKAGYFGDYYSIIDPQEQDENGVITKAIVVGSSPLTTVVIYAKNDGRTALFGAKVWDCGDHWEAKLFYDDATVHLATETMGDEAKASGTDGSDPTKYLPSLENDADGNPIPDSHIETHPGGRMLIDHFRADGRPYGSPLHAKAFGPQDAINKIHATELVSMEYTGFPQRYALMDAGASVADDDIDEDFGTDGQVVDAEHPQTGTGADGRVSPVSGSKLKAVPGSAWLLSGVKSVGEFAAANADNFLKPLDWEVRAMGVLTGTPLFEFDLDGQQPSGESRRLASTRINKHARKLMRSFGQTWENLAVKLLGVLGVVVDPKTVTATWMPAQVELDKDGLALVSAKVKSGVPIHKALTEAGYDPSDVEQWWPAKQTDRLAPDLWVMFGDLMRFMAQAQAADAIAPAELAALLPQYLTQPRESGFMPPPASSPPPAEGGGAAQLAEADSSAASDAQLTDKLINGGQ